MLIFFFTVDIVSVDSTTLECEDESKIRVEKLLTNFAEYYKLNSVQSTNAQIEHYTILGKLQTPNQSVSLQTMVLIQRSFKSIVRDKFLLFGGFLAAIILGLIIGLIFYKNGEDNSLPSLKSRVALLYLNFINCIKKFYMTILRYSILGLQVYPILVFYTYKCMISFVFFFLLFLLLSLFK